MTGACQLRAQLFDIFYQACDAHMARTSDPCGLPVQLRIVLDTRLSRRSNLRIADAVRLVPVGSVA